MLQDKVVRHSFTVPNAPMANKRPLQRECPQTNKTLLFWFERWRQRRALARLDDRLLDDIGVTRTQAKQEAVKPFWRV